MDNKLNRLNELLEPIVELIEKNKRSIDLLLHDIEFDSHINLTDQEFDTLSSVGSCVLGLSRSGGDTEYNALIDIIDKYD